MIIKTIVLPPNPRNPKWGKRDVSKISKIIIHQELGEGDTLSVHNYHTSPKSHLKLGIGAPSIAYHYTIEKDGTVYDCNSDTSITWHTGGQNMRALGIMLVGDFSGENHVGKGDPTKEQLNSLKELTDFLRKKYNIQRSSIYGHKDFGKPSCPGYITMEFIKNYRESTDE